MRPLTEHRPKPLIDVADRPLIDWALDMLRDAGIEHAVVNHHHFGDMLTAHLAQRAEPPKVGLSDESDQLLETGGGVVKALPMLGEDPFYVINADGIWLEGAASLEHLANAWQPHAMDALLLLAKPEKALGFDGPGDFFMDGQGRLTRRGDAHSAPLIYCGIQLVSPALFEEAPDGPFSTNILWDRAIARGRLFGLVHDGHWLHVGTPQARDDAEAFLRQS